MIERLILKGFSIDSSSRIPLPVLSLLGGVIFLGETVILSLSKTYWLTLEYESAVSILGTRFSAPMYISITFR